MEEAVSAALAELQAEGQLTSGQAQVAEQEFRSLGRVFQMHAVVNPALLKKAGKKTFIFIVDAQKFYSIMRGLMEKWQGETCRYVLFGDRDVLVILYGSEEQKDSWLSQIHGAEFAPDTLNVVDTPLIKGHLARSPDPGSGEGVPVAHIDRLVEDYWDPDLEEDRTRLEAQNVLLGPAVMEDMSVTERVLAFVAVWIQGPHPRSRDAYTAFLLGTPGAAKHLRSVYQCEGSYATVLEVVCDSLAELDEFTEIIQTPSGGVRIETTTFVVAKAESQLMPKWSSVVPEADQETGEYSVHVRRIVESEIAARGVELTTHFYELPIDQQLFLTQALTEVRTHSLINIETDWEAEIETGIENFIRGVLRRNPTDLKSSVGCLARAVEGPCKRAVRLAVEALYGTNYGQAQKDLGLQSAKLHKLTLGHCRNAFISINRNQSYQVLGIAFGDDAIERLGWFESRRNELTHEPTPAKYASDFQLFERDTRETWNHGLGLIGWLLTEVLPRNYQMTSIPQALRLREVAREGQFLAEVKSSVAASKNELIDHITRLDQDQRLRMEEVMAALTRLSMMSEALPREEDEWWQRFEALQQSQDEILEQLKPEARSRAKEMIESIRRAGRDVAASAVGNLFFYLILNSPYQGLVAMLDKVFH